MRKFASTAFVVPLFINAILASCQQKPAWIEKEFADASAVPVHMAENFINDTCQPSGLDGIQLLAVQSGHTDTYHLHVYCRQDKAASAHYRVTMVPIPNRQPDKAINPLLDRPNIRIGPFYFGKEGEDDAALLIEMTK